MVTIVSHLMLIKTNTLRGYYSYLEDLDIVWVN
jgi:hypothetical protein